MSLTSILPLVISLAIPLVVGGLSAIPTAKAIPGWYAALNKPSFNPPNWVFSPVWTTLYLLMGVSLYLIWCMPDTQDRTIALVIFVVQLTLNFWWSIVFFYFKRMDIAFGVIVLLWGAILWMIVLFLHLKPVAGYLQLPYLCWVSFASLLNVALWRLNP